MKKPKQKIKHNARALRKAIAKERRFSVDKKYKPNPPTTPFINNKKEIKINIYNSPDVQ